MIAVGVGAQDVAKIAAACSLEAGLKLTTIVYTTNNVTERLAQARDGSGLQVMSMEEVVGEVYGGPLCACPTPSGPKPQTDRHTYVSEWVRCVAQVAFRTEGLASI